MDYKIALIRGDGIGPEVVGEAVKVMERIGERFGHTFAFEGVNILQHETPYTERYDFGTGELRIDKSGISLPNVFYRIDF